MRFKVKKAGTLLEAVMEAYHGISRQKAKQMISHSTFLSNGKPLANRVPEPVNAGDEIQMDKAIGKIAKVRLPRRSRPFSIYFEDEHLIIALKPAGILAAGGENEHSYHTGLEAFLSIRDEARQRLWVVHRLDREVEGLMVFARSRDVQQKILDQHRPIHFRWTVVVEGTGFEEGPIQSLVRETAQHKLVPAEARDKSAMVAKTDFHIIKEIDGFTVLEAIVVEGRNKQIRMQLSDAGFPLLGDRKYSEGQGPKRQLRMAATTVQLNHPVTNRPVHVHYTPASSFFNPAGKSDEHYKIM